MRNKYLIMSILIIFISCDPAYNVVVLNKTENNIILWTRPAIEKPIAIKQGSSYDSIVSKKKNELKDFDIGLYEIKPNNTIFLFGSIGNEPKEYLPFELVRIIKKDDTIEINSQNLMHYIKRKKKNIYFLEIE